MFLSNLIMLNDVYNKKIMLVYGGEDVEGVVSVKSAANIRNSLVNLGYNFCEFEFNQLGLKRKIQQERPDIVFNAMHGKWGEDGILPKILDYENISYTHSGYYASSIAINKALTYQIANSLDIKTPQNRILISKESLLNSFIYKDNNGFSKSNKIILKPNSQGSSIGCYFFDKETIRKQNGLLKLNKEEEDFVRNNKESYYIIEDCFDGFELTSGIFNNKHIGMIKITPNADDFYNYNAKYTAGQTTYQVNPDIKKDLYDKIKDNTLKIHKAIGANFISRCDFIVNNEQTDYVFLEINTHPGFTQTSLIPKMISANYNFNLYNQNFKDKTKLANLSFYDKMVDMLIQNASVSTI